jgi:outer membrane receptor protein involved in Fe transport
MLQYFILALSLQASTSAPSEMDAAKAIPEIVVYSRRIDARPTRAASLSALTNDVLDNLGAAHPNELFHQVPGAWLVRGSGQELLTSIRSPVLTGAGACGAFLLLEDRVPTRPAGFCNVNQMFEVNLLQAQRVDVLRGPGNVIHGSNALHGSVDVSSRLAGSVHANELRLEAGTDDFYRGRFSVSSENTTVYGNFTDAGSFRDQESYQHGFLNASWETKSAGFEVTTRLSHADLDQETAGFILGKDAYKDPVLRRQNLNPEAFRNADATRLTSTWTREFEHARVEIIPYARTSNMLFMQHFIPGTPLEDNGQNSGGVLFGWYGNKSLSAGFDLEWSKGDLFEFQQDPVTGGSRFLQETRPQGAHYDYSVSALALAGWLSWEHDLSDTLRLSAGLRADTIEYDYDNHMLDGNTRDDGTVCGFGGCLYTRPADRSDRFTNLAPELAFHWAYTENTNFHARISRGFRAPQSTELYRLQSGQQVSDLDSVELDAVEMGMRHTREDLALELTAYTMRKRNVIFRDADGFNVSDGKTRHSGIEALLSWALSERLRAAANLAWAQHEYDFDRQLARGEVIRKGNEVDTAPALLGSLRVQWLPIDGHQAELEWLYQHEYYLDAANLHRYEGHNLLNLRYRFAPSKQRYSVALRVTNLLRDHYAERGDFAFGNYRYFPGAGRRFVVEMGWTWD